MNTESKICGICDKEYFKKPSIHKGQWLVSKFCSNKCSNSRPNKGTFNIGHPGHPNSHSFAEGSVPWNKGAVHLPEKLNPSWKGDGVGYHALHQWVKRHLGSPNTCEHCKKTGLTKQQVHWANKTGLYKRDLSDWIRLCSKCHRKYDLKNNLIKVWQR